MYRAVTIRASSSPGVCARFATPAHTICPHRARRPQHHQPHQQPTSASSASTSAHTGGTQSCASVCSRTGKGASTAFFNDFVSLTLNWSRTYDHNNNNNNRNQQQPKRRASINISLAAPTPARVYQPTRGQSQQIDAVISCHVCVCV